MNFTVVIPLYNKEDCINRAIKSVINQSYRKFELIIIDDGSTDNSAKEVAKFDDNRIRVIHKTNGGVSSARNRGINEAKYDFIGFLDADDEWKQDFLQTIKILIENYPQAGAYAMSYEIQREDSSVIIPLNEKTLVKDSFGIIDDYFRMALKNPIITSSSVVIPKKVFANLGCFPAEIKYGEDLDMWRRIALNYDIAFHKKIGAIYFQDASNRACKRERRLEESSARYAEELLTQAKDSGNCSIYYEEYMIKIILAKAEKLIKNNKRSDARKILYQYKYTKLNRKTLIKLYIFSFIPSWKG